MFNQLLESKAKKERMAGGTMFSIVLHTVLIGGAVYATARAGVKDEKAKAEKIQFVEMKKEPPKVEPKEPPPKEVIVKPPPPKGFQVLRAPLLVYNEHSHYPPFDSQLSESLGIPGRRITCGDCYLLLDLLGAEGRARHEAGTISGGGAAAENDRRTFEIVRAG